MKKRMFLAAGAVLVAAAVSAFVYVKNENNSMNELFNANVEALANNEGTPVKICYVERVEGPSEWAIFCNRATSSSMLYPCNSETYGCKGVVSHCTK